MIWLNRNQSHTVFTHRTNTPNIKCFSILINSANSFCIQCTLLQTHTHFKLSIYTCDGFNICIPKLNDSLVVQLFEYTRNSISWLNKINNDGHHVVHQTEYFCKLDYVFDSSSTWISCSFCLLLKIYLRNIQFEIRILTGLSAGPISLKIYSNETFNDSELFGVVE